MATPTLLVSGKVEPRKVIGSVDTSEFLVATAASIGFLIGIGSAGINFGYVAALLIGGLIAAPIAAYLVKIIPPQMLGSLVGGFIVLTNSRLVINNASLQGWAATSIYATIAMLWGAAVVWSFRKTRSINRTRSHMVMA